ncbi:hypothetical protein TNIN_377591 [Trichonephila inaurata madagascariensis]|uniref:Uncharacterized protein n=1 Tax=Trichonephila inaurata madagascariensis TaxID=2747483 RepID=A0A8X7CKR3_9ARAC|nr:hypothetical protein TNIN_377591 [Trichonephila inaurata madagascariensis]
MKPYIGADSSASVCVGKRNVHPTPFSHSPPFLLVGQGKGKRKGPNELERKHFRSNPGQPQRRSLGGPSRDADPILLLDLWAETSFSHLLVRAFEKKNPYSYLARVSLPRLASHYMFQVTIIPEIPQIFPFITLSFCSKDVLRTY